MCIEKLYTLYDVEELTGIDQAVLAGMIEEKRLNAVIVAGEYKIRKSDVVKWADDVVRQM